MTFGGLGLAVGFALLIAATRCATFTDRWLATCGDRGLYAERDLMLASAADEARRDPLVYGIGRSPRQPQYRFAATALRATSR